MTTNKTNIKQYTIGKDNLNTYNFDYHPGETETLRDIFASINASDALTIDHLRRVALWKIGRIINIPDDLIHRLDELAKNKSITKHNVQCDQILTALMKCKGVALPMASTILKFVRGDIFPIIDKRAYRALFGKPLSLPTKIESLLKIYSEYREKIYDMADKHPLKLRQIDELLYAFDKKHNGKL